MTDIIKFPWDEEGTETIEKYEDVAERLKFFQQRIDDSKNKETKIAKFN